MKNVERVARGFRHVGEVSSKYGYDPDQFTKDIENDQLRYAELWDAFVQFMKSHNVDPREFKAMFLRYYEEFITERMM